MNVVYIEEIEKVVDTKVKVKNIEKHIAEIKK